MKIRSLRALMGSVLTGIVLSATAQAQPQNPHQNVQPPAGLKWQWMHDAAFNADNIFITTALNEEKELLAKIWSKEINSTGLMNDGSRYPSFVVIGNIAYKNNKITLTMFNSFNSTCLQPGNGRGMVDMYATCSLKLIWWPPSKSGIEKNLPVNFCMLYGDDSHNPRSKNHNEYAFDEHTGILYLRTIQYGKVVPDCNRILRVLKV